MIDDFLRFLHYNHSNLQTFESYDEDENEESSQVNANHKSSDLSSGEEETLINKRITDDAASHYSHHSSIPLMPPYRRDYSSYTDPSFLNRFEYN